jgi:hypothetical protein
VYMNVGLSAIAPMPRRAAGRPRVLRVPRLVRRGMGDNTALDLATNVAAAGGTSLLQSSDPYFNSPAFLASQQASEEAECNFDPTSPGCEVSEVTGELATGGPTAAGVAFTAGQYCEQDQFNSTYFGSAPDTVNCNGSTPLSGAITGVAQEYALTGGTTSQLPAPAVPTVVAPSTTITPGLAVPALVTSSSLISPTASPSGGVVPAASPLSTVLPASITNALTNSVNLFGLQVPVWGLGLGAIAALFLFSSMGSER